MLTNTSIIVFPESVKAVFTAYAISVFLAIVAGVLFGWVDDVILDIYPGLTRDDSINIVAYGLGMICLFLGGVFGGNIFPRYWLLMMTLPLLSYFTALLADHYFSTGLTPDLYYAIAIPASLVGGWVGRITSNQSGVPLRVNSAMLKRP